MLQMAEARTTGKDNGASRQAVIKKLSKTFMPESMFISKLGKLIDTNLGSVNLETFKNRLFGIGSHRASVTSHNIVRSGLYAAAGFPPAIQCSELIMECANCYEKEHRSITSPDGQVLANLTPAAIGEAFGIPVHRNMIYKSRERAERMYASAFERCMDTINTHWMSTPKPSRTKLPKQIIADDLKQEYCDLIMMLSRVGGCAQSFIFEP